MKKTFAAISFFYAFTALAQITVTDKESGVTQTIGFGGNTVKQGEQISDEGLASFKTGVSTYDEVVAKLGKPKSVKKTKGYTMATYSSHKGEVKVDPIKYIPIIGSLFGSVKNEQSFQMIIFMFDANNVLMRINDMSSKGAVEDKGLVDQINKLDIKIGN